MRRGLGIYSEEHRIFQESIRRFAAEKILPHVTSWEEAENFPSSIFADLGAQGFLGTLIAEEWGGTGGDYLLAGAWCEEFGRIPSVGFTTAVNMHALVITPTLAKFGSTTSKEKWLRSAVAGTAIGAYAFTEPNAGSDLTNVQTKATRDGDGYILNGAKTFITNGARADFILVLAKTDPAAGYDGYTTFVVDTKLPGFSVARKLSKLGWYCSDTAELTFDNVKLDSSAVLGTVGRGWYQAMESLQWERLMLTLGALGGARSCISNTLNYIRDRKVFGKSVAEFDNTQEVLASLVAELRGVTALTHNALQLLNNGARCRKESSLAKYYGCELAIRVADRCLQFHGGYGYTTEFLPERWLRDLRLNTIGGGTSEIMSRIAAREILADNQPGVE